MCFKSIKDGDLMNITKYGAATVGYGFLKERNSYGSFFTNIKIVAESPKTTRTYKEFKWDRVVDFDIGKYKVTSVYVVFDEDTDSWKEYFSGTTIPLASEPSCVIKESVSRYDVIKGSTDYFDVDKGLKYYGELTIGNILECNATEFDIHISKYTETQKKIIARRIPIFEKDAKQWKLEFESLVQKVKDDRARKESGISDTKGKIESELGKYGNNNSSNNAVKSVNIFSPGFGNASSNIQHSKPKQLTTPTKEEKIQWIQQNRCSYCGGQFKGLLSKVCRDCGKAKDYK